MVFLWHLPDRFLMRLDVFLNLSTKFKNFSQFLLSNFNFNRQESQVGPINHISLSFAVHIYILITPVVEQMLYDWYVFAVEMEEWGPYEALTPTEKMAIWLRQLRGAPCG